MILKMINPGDLILGAYVKCGDRIEVVTEINECVITAKDSSGDELFASKDNYDHIPLTEQWLVDFKFDKTNESYYEKDGIGFICGYAVDGSFLVQNTFGPRHIHVYYVHQLQGLVKFLTGKLLKK